jgi:hypothetical protein
MHNTISDGCFGFTVSVLFWFELLSLTLDMLNLPFIRETQGCIDAYHI